MRHQKVTASHLNFRKVSLIKLLAVNCVKQASAFPPNFIHSLDATHMMLTALECRVRGFSEISSRFCLNTFVESEPDLRISA